MSNLIPGEISRSRAKRPGGDLDVVEIDVHAALEPKTSIVLHVLHVHARADTILEDTVDGNSKDDCRVRKAILEVSLRELSTPEDRLVKLLEFF